MFIYGVSHYAQPTSHMARYALRVDGFVSVIDHVVAWSTGPGAASLAGKAIRLRFALRDADLYSLRFF